MRLQQVNDLEFLNRWRFQAPRKERRTAWIEGGLQLAEITNDVRMTGAFLCLKADIISIDHRFQEATQLLERAFEQYSQLNDESGRARVLLGSGTLALRRGKARQAVEHLQAALEQFHREGPEEYRIRAEYQLSRALTQVGSPEEAYSMLESAMEGAEKLGMDSLLTDCRNDLGIIAFQAGRPLTKPSDNTAKP